jgi:hypothetical protein
MTKSLSSDNEGFQAYSVAIPKAQVTGNDGNRQTMSAADVGGGPIETASAIAEIIAASTGSPANMIAIAPKVLP